MTTDIYEEIKQLKPHDRVLLSFAKPTTAEHIEKCWVYFRCHDEGQCLGTFPGVADVDMKTDVCYVLLRPYLLQLLRLPQFLLEFVFEGRSQGLSFLRTQTQQTLKISCEVSQSIYDIIRRPESPYRGRWVICMTIRGPQAPDKPRLTHVSDGIRLQIMRAPTATLRPTVTRLPSEWWRDAFIDREHE